MKHLKTYEGLFNKNKYEEGDKLMNRLIDIIKNEDISIKHSGGYNIELDNKIYSFARSGRSCWVTKYDNNQNNGKFWQGEPESKYDFSVKIWKELDNLHKEQNKPDLSNDLDNLTDENRTAKKMGLL